MKKILITGAGTGLGLGAAVGLAKAGHRVIASVQQWPQVAELRRHVADLGLEKTVIVERLDILDARHIDVAVNWDFDTFVSNAGVGGAGPMRKCRSISCDRPSRSTCSAVSSSARSRFRRSPGAGELPLSHPAIPE
jgi:NAD(P)-dependent dehydrogenase (short-subunit alcohol dehydrogenase family)